MELLKRYGVRFVLFCIACMVGNHFGYEEGVRDTWKRDQKMINSLSDELIECMIVVKKQGSVVNSQDSLLERYVILLDNLEEAVE